MHFAETATERSTAELLWALPHLKGAMPRSGRQCDLVSAEIARRQQDSPPFSSWDENTYKEVISSHTTDPSRHMFADVEHEIADLSWDENTYRR